MCNVLKMKPAKFPRGFHAYKVVKCIRDWPPPSLVDYRSLVNLGSRQRMFELDEGMREPLDPHNSINRGSVVSYVIGATAVAPAGSPGLFAYMDMHRANAQAGAYVDSAVLEVKIPGNAKVKFGEFIGDLIVLASEMEVISDVTQMLADRFSNLLPHPRGILTT